MDPNNWYEIEDPGAIGSPALLVYPERIRHNIAQMLRIAGGPERLRPHVKTHKMAEIIRMQLEAGIGKFKCATLAEALLLARCGAGDVLVAYPLTGPGPGRLAKMQGDHPGTRFSCLVDHPDTLAALEDACRMYSVRLGVFLDLNVGMDRTGMAPGNEAASLYRRITASTAVESRGLHVYDGHLRNPDPRLRAAECDRAFERVSVLARGLQEEGVEIPAIVAGGSPTFPIHARRAGVELSPGTTLLWDARYGQQFPEMPFLPAAVLLCRVISSPREGMLCLDLGHKAVAAEMDFPRVLLPQLPGNTQVSQSEEHLVLKTEDAGNYPVGTLFYAIPMHICPTVIKYPWALVVRDGKVTGRWEVAARDYAIPV